MKWLKTCLKSASYVCQRIFVAFGKVNNTQGGDHPADSEGELCSFGSGLSTSEATEQKEEVISWPSFGSSSASIRS
jgi:hypothetical protein